VVRSVAKPTPDEVSAAIPGGVPASPVVRFAVEPDRTSAIDEPDQPVQPSERQVSTRSSMSMAPSLSRIAITRA
jgi:hypothetical protein